LFLYNEWIAFFSGGKLKKVEASGGPVETLCDAPLGRGGTWNREGLILFSPNISQPLYQVAAAGGAATPLTQMEASRQEVTHRWPEFLPDGKHYLFFVRAATPSLTGVYIGTLGSREHRQVISSSMNAAYAAPGYLLYARGDVLVAQPFDAKRMQVTGTPVQLAQDVSVMPATNYVSFSVSQTGTLIYSSEAIEIGRQLYWYDRQGKELGKLGPPEYGSWPQLSPDGKKLALRLYTQPAGNFEIWVYDLARGIHARASFTGLTAFASVWSPDGTQLAYSHSTSQVSGDHMYLLNADGRGKEELLEQPFLESMANYPSSWSPDGQVLLFDHQDRSGKISVWVLPMHGERKPHAFVDTQFKAEMGKFSPDGGWVAYVSNDSGRDEVYVLPFPGPGARVQISTGGGTQPRWRGDGRELVYLSPETKLMAAEVAAAGNNFHVGEVRALFLLSGLGGVPGYLYDMTPDGQRFIAVQDLEHTSTIPLTVVINWNAEMNKP
jgi:Tol biopolymer transport system component